jgi:response regulator of citrate/malate metabolism
MKLDKILIIEDDMIIQLFISKALKNADFEIVGEGRSCKQALELLTKTEPDLILMDIGIAGDKDGIETAELINQDYDIPILFMTGNSDITTTERARKTNPIDILLKPIDEGRLKNKLLQLKNDKPI